MKLSEKRPGGFLLSTMMAGVIALSLPGCGEEPPPKPAAKSVPQASPPPEAKAAPAPVKPAVADAQATSDQTLAERIKSALGAAPGLNAHRIDITVKDGVVTLFGTAETKAQRETAGKAAAAVPGVKSVENKLAIVAGS